MQEKNTKNMDTNLLAIPEYKKPKQVILVRTDIGMKPGKLASQVAHASMKVFFDREEQNAMQAAQAKFGLPQTGGSLKIAMTPDMWEWKNGEFTKIILEVHSEEELLVLYAKASGLGIPCALIQDNGHTVFKGVKTYTTAAIGPANPDDIDKITGELKLLK